MSKFSRFSWRPEAVIKATEQKLSRNLDSVGVYLQRYIVQSFGSPAAPPEGGARSPVLGKRIKAKTYRRSQHSRPGQTPFVQFGTLRASITFSREGLKRLLIGSSLKPVKGSKHSYAWWLEWGSGKMAPRPYLRPGIRKNKRTIVKMIASK